MTRSSYGMFAGVTARPTTWKTPSDPETAVLLTRSRVRATGPPSAARPGLAVASQRTILLIACPQRCDLDFDQHQESLRRDSCQVRVERLERGPGQVQPADPRLYKYDERREVKSTSTVVAFRRY
jgi:hypothetical protein